MPSIAPGERWSSSKSGSVRVPRKFRFKHKLVSLDSTLIDLCLSVFDWAKFRRTKGAVKLHLVLDHDGYLPCFGVITEGSVHDVKVAWRIPFAAGTVVVDDRAYNDYRLFAYWSECGVFFVTRMKDNALYEVLEERPGFLEKRRVVLDGLATADSEALVEHLLGGTPLPSDSRARVFEAAEGNPLFLEQLVALATEGDPLDADRPLPATVQALLAARLDRLGPGERAVLERAAVIGRDFTASEVTTLLDPEAVDLASFQKQLLDFIRISLAPPAAP